MELISINLSKFYLEMIENKQRATIHLIEKINYFLGEERNYFFITCTY